MELGAVHLARLHHAGDGQGIVADGQCVGGAVFAVVAVDVVEILAVPDVLEQRVVPQDVDGVPADLRHFQALVAEVGSQRAYLPRHEAKAVVLAVLVALFKQQLHPEADAEEGLLRRFFLDDRYKAGGLKFCHRVPEGAHARQDEPVSGADVGGVRADLRFQPQMGQTRFQAEQVAHAVVDDAYHTSSPFVEGISSRWAASMRTASASARPAPLNAASRMWWLFSPAN